MGGKYLQREDMHERRLCKRRLLQILGMGSKYFVKGGNAWKKCVQWDLRMGIKYFAKGDNAREKKMQRAVSKHFR
ncbi:MAG: hypothetical protein AB2705_22525 [Candidatus Thiodiazotropha sp.]